MRNLLFFSIGALGLAACGPAVTAPMPLREAGGTPCYGNQPTGRYYALSQVLAREQERSTALQAQLDDRTHEVQQLRNELQGIRDREEKLRAALHAAAAANERFAAAEAAAGSHLSGAAGDAPQADVMASLRTELQQETTRRRSVEMQLARLKEETSAPAYGSPGAEAELVAAKQEVAAAKQEIAATKQEIAATKQEVVAAKQQANDLQAAVAEERAARQRLAEEFRALQERATQDTAAIQNGSAEGTELRTRLASLQSEKDALAESFRQNLAESQKKTWELEQQLATARVTAAALPAQASAPELSAVRDENMSLRARLDDEHRRTEDLASKLKMAARVTELIFKMQAQQPQAAPVPAQ